MFTNIVECEPAPAIISYQSGELVIDFENLRVTNHHGPVKLTPKEWDTLRVLVRNLGRVVVPRLFLNGAEGAKLGNGKDYVRTCITRLRRKLEPDPQRPRYILLERGLGYRLADPNWEPVR